MRKILAIILGALIGSMILLAVGFIANTIHTTPPELMDPATPEAVAQRVAATTTSTWLTVIFGLSLGSFFWRSPRSKTCTGKNSPDNHIDQRTAFPLGFLHLLHSLPGVSLGPSRNAALHLPLLQFRGNGDKES